MIVTPRSDPTARVWLNGKEVTRDCFYADSGLGIVRLYKRDADGYWRKDAKGDGTEAEWEELRGSVQIEAGLRRRFGTWIDLIVSGDEKL